MKLSGKTNAYAVIRIVRVPVVHVQPVVGISIANVGDVRTNSSSAFPYTLPHRSLIALATVFIRPQ